MISEYTINEYTCTYKDDSRETWYECMACGEKVTISDNDHGFGFCYSGRISDNDDIACRVSLCSECAKIIMPKLQELVQKIVFSVL